MIDMSKVYQVKNNDSMVMYVVSTYYFDEVMQIEM